jgi:hypothetical protein
MMTDHHAVVQQEPPVTATAATSTLPCTYQQQQQHHHHHHVVTTTATGIQRRSTVLQEQGPIIAQPVSSPSLLILCGLFAGIAQAGVFNPYDRALYLSVRDNRPFLHSSNWHNPYTGFLQSISGRAIQGGLYFPLEHYFLHTLNKSSKIEFLGWYCCWCCECDIVKSNIGCQV